MTGPALSQRGGNTYYCGYYSACPINFGCCVGRGTPEQCFDPSKGTCVADSYGNGKASVYPFTSNGPQKGCQETTYSLPTCYDPTESVCCHQQGSSIGTVIPIEYAATLCANNQV